MKKRSMDDPLRSKKLRTTYFTSIVSLAFLLFVVGLLELFVLHGNKLTRSIRENINFSIMLHNDARPEMVLMLRQKLEQSGFAHSSKYISKEEAAKSFSTEIGEDFVKFLGYNPLPQSIDIQLNSGYSNSDSLAKLEHELRANPIVEDITYNKSMVDRVNRNIQKISLILTGLGLVLLIIAIILIHNTIWLSVYSRRFVIRTMQLIGATNTFIRMPFLKRSIIHGIYAALMAIAFLIAVIYFAGRTIPELSNLSDYQLFGITFAGLLLFGVLLSVICTYFSLRKLIRTKADKLYTA